MRPIKTILVPTDFSAASKRALSYACNIADGFGATLHVLHVLQDPFTADGYMGLYLPNPEVYTAKAEQQARAELQSLLTDAQKEAYSAAFVLKWGTPVHEILDYIRSHGGIDLVVLATSGHGAVARMMLGSVADKLVRQAPCPVLTVHEHDRSDSAGEDRAA